MKEQIDNQTLKLYIDKLIAFYGLYPVIKETALKIQFDHNLFSECIIEIMHKMGLNNRIKVTCYADYKYPCNKSAARIGLPQPMPMFGTHEFNTFQMHIEIRESIRKHFYAFVSSIAHELSHVVMHGTNHELMHSEIATDLCVLVFGFSDFVVKGKNVAQWTAMGFQSTTIGYLSEEQLRYAVTYLNQLRNKISQPQKNKKKTGIDSFIDAIRKLF